MGALRHQFLQIREQPSPGCGIGRPQKSHDLCMQPGLSWRRGCQWRQLVQTLDATVIRGRITSHLETTELIRLVPVPLQ